MKISEGAFSALCAQINSSLHVHDLVDYIDWHADKIVRSGDVFFIHCPIHRDEVFRTLVLNPRNNTYHCKHVNCPGSRPSDFLDLVVKVSEKTLPEVLIDIVDHFGAEYFRLTDYQLRIIAEAAKEIEDPPQGGTGI